MSVDRTIDPDRVKIERNGGVADVRLTRAAKHNGLDRAMFDSITAAIDQLRDQDDLLCVVLSGEGPSFCAGLDIKSFASGDGDGDTSATFFAHDEGEVANFAQRVAFGWRELPVPVIVALHGSVLGGGLQIALGADIRIAAPATELSVMEIAYGLIPDMSASQTLLRLVRDDVARELTYSGRKVEAAEALELGLVTRIADDPVAEARRLAAEIATRSPDAIRAAKRLLNEAPKLSAAEGLALEQDLQAGLIGSLARAASS